MTGRWGKPLVTRLCVYEWDYDSIDVPLCGQCDGIMRLGVAKIRIMSLYSSSHVANNCIGMVKP